MRVGDGDGDGQGGGEDWVIRRHHVHRAKEEASRRAWLAQAAAWDGTQVSAGLGMDGGTATHYAKVPGDDPRYKECVAEPVMAAVDQMPKDYRTVLHEHGYVDVYRAWKRGWSPDRIAAAAARNGGRFVL